MSACKCPSFASLANNRITIQSRNDTADATGDVTEAWATLADVWAVIKPLKAREVLAQRQNQGQATHLITIRYRTDMVPVGTATTRRILFGSRTFNITGAINVDERNEYLELTCDEGVPT